ncbi:hypothetical protein LCGC14_2684370, partial [marine sediment metagenome]
LAAPFLLRQITDGGDAVLLQRQTDTSPTGNVLRVVNVANTVNLYKLDVLGRIFPARVLAAGTALVAGDFALSGGWGTTASIGTITGNDQWFQATITSAGTGQGANPTATLTFQDGTWTNAPIAVCQRADRASQTTIEFTWTTTPTTLVLTFEGTPVAAEAFTVACHIGGV